MLRMDEIYKIKKAFERKGKSKNSIARQFNRSWATVDKIVESTPDKLKSRGQRPNRGSKLMTPELESRVNDFFDEEIRKGVHHKQRFTMHYMFKTISSQGQYYGSERHFRTIVNRIRKKRDLLKPKPSFLDLDFEFGKYLQLDHGEAHVILRGQKIKGFLFVATIPKVPIRFCQLFLTKSSESWGEFHERAFRFYGGVFEHCTYDHDTVLVVPKTDRPTEFLNQLKNYYDFDPIFCNRASGWEKGAVENGVGYCRRNFLAGFPEFESLDVCNSYLKEECIKELESFHSDDRPLSVWHQELPLKLNNLACSHSWGIESDALVSSQQTVIVDGFSYSVPEKYVGSTVKVIKTVSEVKIYDDLESIYTHPRCYLKSDRGLVLDHFLEHLLRKPRAVAFARVVKQTIFPEEIIKLRKRLQERHSYPDCEKEFIQVLRIRRKYFESDFLTAIGLALEYGSVESAAVEMILQQLTVTETIPDIPTVLLPKECAEIKREPVDLNVYASLSDAMGVQYA